jgi:predicted RND superfamily exporter protein
MTGGGALERVLFEHRLAVIAACAVVTLILGFEAAKLRPNASYERTIPASHPYAINFLTHQRDLAAAGNVLRVAVATKHGSIYDASYLTTLQRINDDLFLLPGVDRPFLKSLWTPNTRWLAVTEEGLEGGPVMPERYDGSPERLRELQSNVARSGEIGHLVAADGKSSVIHVPLVATQANGQALDYGRLTRQLEQIRAKYEIGDIKIHIVGFAKLAGDLLAGLREIGIFFALAAAIAVSVLYAYTRCVRSTMLVALMSAVAVIWQLGALRVLGYDLDAYSMLVPFLIFAIGISHGAQKMNGIMQDVGRGASRYEAARRTFRRLFRAGLAALLADAAGFLVLLVIDIDAIRHLALAATIGVTALIVTNLVLLPILLSYTGVSSTAAARSMRTERARSPARAFCVFTTRRGATAAVVGGAFLAGLGLVGASHLRIGDLEPGAPELRPGSRYNRDLAFMNASYDAAGDVFAIMVKTPDQQCAHYDALMRIDALEWQLRQLPFVESTTSLALLNRQMLVGFTEGNPKWHELVSNQATLNSVTSGAPRGLYNETCGLSIVYVYLRDHAADTLTKLVDHVERFAASNDTADVSFLLAAGGAGVEATTNIVVSEAWRRMMLLVYAAVIVLVFIVFRSWRVVLVAVVPLMLTSILAEGLMALLGLGVKVATLPVIVLGVGLGVDYAFYILAVMLAYMKEGVPLPEAHRRTMAFTGKVVLLTGSTLAVGVATWGLSEIKFQADMGILLAFMILVNMLGTLILVPALSHFLVERPTPRGRNPQK